MMQKLSWSRKRSTGRTRPGTSSGVRQLLQALEPRVLLASDAIGNVDIFNRTTIAGWTVNADDGASALNVQITINSTSNLVLAVQSRPDLIPTLGSPYHGFSFSVPTLPAGNSTVKIEAISPSTGVHTVLKTGTLVNPPPVGSVDLLSATHVAGWAYDPDSGAPIQVRVDVDGVTGTPFTTNVSRPDVSSVYHVDNTGFDLAGNFAGHVVEVYGLDSAAGTPTLLYTNNQAARGNVDVNDSLTVAGWAFDPDSGAAAINVRVDVDGVTLAGTPTAANLARPDLVSAFGSANHGFSIAIPGLTPGTHTISVFALDGQAASAAPVLIGSSVVNNPAPIGHVDLINSTMVAGWALDPDMGPNPTAVNVYVDDSLFATVSASMARPDLTSIFGSPNHGFAVDLSSLPAGSHSVTVTAVDNRVSNENEVVIYDDFINNHVPIGSFDSYTATKIYGWAYDSDAGNSPIEVDIYVDGVYADTTVANLARADVDSFLGSPNHAFVADMPTLSYGTHKIDLYGAESQGNVSVLIGSQQVTNNRPIGSIDFATGNVVVGWAADPEQLGQSVAVEVYVNGALAGSGSANLLRPDLANAPALAPGAPYFNHGYSLVLGLAAGRNQIDVFAVDLNNGFASPLGSVVVNI